MSSRSYRLGGFAFALCAFLATAPAVRAETPAPKKYAFATPPLEIYDRFAKTGLAKTEPFTDSERKFLADLWAARTAKPAKAVPSADDNAVTAHLIASGVGDPKARAAYLKKFNALVDAAKKATAGAKTDSERADQLLRFLHKEVMAKGYESGQSRLSVLFDTGTYNCVSSSCLYYLVGTRLGLKFQPILIPGSFLAGHAAVDLIDGKNRIDIEPTNADGFDWETKLKKPGVISFGIQPDRKAAHDADGFALAASIASNLCGEAKERPGEAVRWGAIALVLAPTDDSAENNLLATVNNWALGLMRSGKYEDALVAHACARGALGPTKDLEHNHNVTWCRYLDATFDDGRTLDGLKVLRRAAAAFPDDRDFKGVAAWVGRAAERKAEKDGWAAGIVYADAALKDLTGDDAKAVRAWKDSSRRMRSQRLLDDGDVAGSFAVLAAGLKEHPESGELIDGLIYHTQEGLAYLNAEKGTAAAVAHYKELTAAYPKEKGIPDRAYHVAFRALGKLLEAKKFEEALKAVKSYEPLAGARTDELRANVYDHWGWALNKGGDCEAGIKKYVEGLAAVPKNALLSNNVIVIIDRWAGEAIDKGDWAAAIARYDTGLKYFPDSGDLKHNRAYCIEKRDKK